ncbi:MAG: CDP-glucose 4,6-dehydratase, partial [Chloroflexota bacterium]|nr:CDP-glucose 4,6-dehydratase [Chloroflexota bacterium]
LGGFDPYSSSKACAELVTSAFRNSFFLDPSGTQVASARAGNVIGGGDWGQDRLMPDLMRAALTGEPARLRNPNAVRPWQHVLNPLSGYVLLAQELWQSSEYADAWNFGPPEDDARSVGSIVQEVADLWPQAVSWEYDDGPHPHEAGYLKLDSSRARRRLGWQPPMSLEEALRATVEWYRQMAEGADMRAVTLGQIEALDGAAASP